MNQDFDGPAWADHHDKLTDAIDRPARALWHAFRRFHDRQYAAPWRRVGGAPLVK